MRKPYTDEQLDAAAWIDLKRTEVGWKARDWARRAKNEVDREALAAVDAGRKLKVSSKTRLLELPAGDNEDVE